MPIKSHTNPSPRPRKAAPVALDGKPLVFTGLFDEAIDDLRLEAAMALEENLEDHVGALKSLGLPHMPAVKQGRAS